jgi:hypothetical protein
VASGDFFLFGYIKGKLSDYRGESRKCLLNAMTEIFTGAYRKVLFNVFESWTNRRKWVIKHVEKYHTK